MDDKYLDLQTGLPALWSKIKEFLNGKTVYITQDLTDGVSELESGKIYVVYEE